MTDYLTLRIKKKFFREILENKKRIEYREKRPYYDKIFQKKYRFIRFHYQSKEKIICVIKEIKEIINIYPKDKRPKYLSTDIIYAIKFKNISHLNDL